jgi:hypothetical protein
MKNIAIIGGGWVGCHLAKEFSKEHNITIYERNDQLISEASLINQNRLHYGYHYARNGKTRQLCRTTFHAFLKDYGHLVEDVPNNLYAVSQDESLLDDATILTIFDEWPHRVVYAPWLDNTSCAIATPEKFINPLLASEFFDALLSSFVVNEEIVPNELPFLQQDYDLVLDCTNNFLLEPEENCFFERVMMMLYTIEQPLPFGALTYIDGELFSLYPYGDGLMSLSHVKHGILSQSASPVDGYIDCDYNLHRSRMENHAKQYWPDFDLYLRPVAPVCSTKAKIKNKSANRMPVYRQRDNFISIFTGKIQGIYAIKNHIQAIINQA